MFLSYSYFRFTNNKFTRHINFLLVFLFSGTASFSQNPCDSYTHVQANYSGIRIGDLDITGNQLTVEAVFNRTEDYGHDAYGGDLVSKHCSPYNCNYLLRPTRAEITTTVGFFTVELPCSLEPNTTYHISMVYNGETLSIFKNGLLEASVPATGDLVTNDLFTTIGTTACWDIHNTHFKGYISEVRIWNVARTWKELHTFYNIQLNPSSWPALQAYYRGNPYDLTMHGWNGTDIGTVSHNQTNPSCAIDPSNCFSFARTGFDKATQSKSVAAAATAGSEAFLSENSKIVIYPNPAKKSVTLEYDAASAATVTFNIVDITGKTAMTMKKSVNKGKNAISVNVDRLTNGIYFIQLIDDDKTLTRKLIVNK